MVDSPEVQAIVARGKITAEDILKLRNRVFSKGVVTPNDAEMVFHLNDRIDNIDNPSWSIFFVETLTDYVVMQAEPQGYISDENAEWLIARISHSGHVDNENELEVLVKALERARQSPVGLVKFALEQVKHGVLNGSGVVGHKHRLEPGVVGEGEVELLRRILFAFGGDGNMAITKQEAEILFDINDATSEVDNHPAWSDLFVKAIANFLMASVGYRVPNRHEALRREAWLDSPSAGVGGFMSRMLAGSLDAVWDAYQNGSRDSGAKASSGLTNGDEPRATAEEIRWVADRMGSDGQLHANEMALIDFLKGHCAHLHPKLSPVLDRAAA